MKTKLAALAIRMLILIALGSWPFLVLASGGAYAATIFSDFGTSGPNYDGTAYGLDTLAVQFTSAHNIPVKQIDVALYWLGHVGTTNAATVSLVTDPSGDPGVFGTTLGSWSLVNLPTYCCGSPSVETISGITGVNLKAGDLYFLIVSAGGADTLGWAFNSNGQYGTIDWGGSIRVNQNPLPLFDILGPPVVSQTPLPAALPLFATCLGVMGVLGWRRKRQAHAHQGR